MSDGAPVCNLPNIGSQPPLQPGIKLPVVPKAIDLPSALQAISQLTFIVQQLAGQSPPFFPNNLNPNTAQVFNLPALLRLNAISTPPTGSGGTSSGGNKDKQGRERWREIDRVTERVKIVNPDDDTQFVIFDRINSITWEDSLTGATFSWERKT